MIKEALEYLSGQARKAAAVQVVHPEGEPKHHYAVVKPDGSLQWQEAEPTPRDHKAASLQPVVDFALRPSGDYGTAVWFSRTGVTCLTDDGTRRDRVTMPVTLSPQMTLLEELRKSRAWWSQKDFVRLLKVDLAGCLGTAGNLLDIVRAVKFVNNAAGESVVAHGKTSIGRSIQQEITGAGSLPEYVALDVPAFFQATVPYRSTVQCAIDVEASNSTFQLVPLPGQVEAAVADCEKRLGQTVVEMLAAGGGKKGAVDVFFGRPE